MTSHNDLPDIFKKNTVNLTSSKNALEQQALEIINSMSGAYPTWTLPEVEKLQTRLKRAEALMETDLDAYIRSDLYPIIHDIKGQGTTFGYPLMTALGTHACAVVKENECLTHHHLALIAQDVFDMHYVLTNHLEGQGGELGEKITNRLAQKD